MKILQLGKFYPIRGGVEKVMLDLTTGLSSSGTRCDMLCAMSGKDSVDKKDLPFVAEAGKGLTALLQLNPLGRVLCTKSLAKAAGTMISPAMIRYLRAHKDEYDLIHVHHPDPMAALALLLSGFKGRVVLHWHSDIISQKTFFRLYRPIQNWLLRRADAVVCTTPAYIEGSEHLKMFKDKCSSVPIGIAPVLPDAQAVGEMRSRYPGKHLILSVGRLVPYKGYSYLIQAMASLDDSYHLVIGGKGPLEEQLKSQARECGVTDKVTFLGYVPDEDMPSWFGACDVFVLPSVMKTEAFGIVQIEAMSCGKPVIATRIPGSGVSWVNADGVSGYNVEPCDPEGLAEALRKICENPSEKEKLGKSALERFNSLFTLPKMTEKVLNLYFYLLKQDKNEKS